jgi:hypothetical protein
MVKCHAYHHLFLQYDCRGYLSWCAQSAKLSLAVRQLIEAVTAKEMKNSKKGREKAPPSIVLDPPFSPIGRV